MSTEQKIKDVIEIPHGIEVSLHEDMLRFKGPKGTLEKKVRHPYFTIKIDGDKLMMIPNTKKYSKNEKRIIHTFKAHIKNFIHGVEHAYVYQLKVVSGHFPMTVAVDGASKIVIKNFLGEKVPRVADILPNVKATIKNDLITVESVDKEAAGQTAANIETATRITNRDRRIFQDGVFIIEKPKRSL